MNAFTYSKEFATARNQLFLFLGQLFLIFKKRRGTISIIRCSVNSIESFSKIFEYNPSISCCCGLKILPKWRKYQPLPSNNSFKTTVVGFTNFSMHNQLACTCVVPELFRGFFA